MLWQNFEGKTNCIMRNVKVANHCNCLLLLEPFPNTQTSATFFLGSMKRKFVDLQAVSNPPRSFYSTIIAIFIEYPAGASAEERETGGPMKLFTKDLTLIETPKLIELVRVFTGRLFN